MGRGTATDSPTAVLTRSASWTRDMPIDLERLTPKRFEDLRSKVATVLSANPLSGVPDAPLYAPVPDPAPLPATCPRILGICGKPKAGKDVIADFLAAHYRDVQRTSFSASVIPEVNTYLAAQGTDHVIDMGNKSIPMYREILQAWGMSQFENEPAYWAGKTRDLIKTFEGDPRLIIIITGVRLPADAAMIKEIGGETWRAVRPGNPYVAEHDVENVIDDLEVDREILNPVENELRPYEMNIEAALVAAR